MTREEKANSLGQMYFPDEANIWARPNYEAKFVSDACLQMAEWERNRLIEKACDWLRTTSNFYQGGSDNLPEVICMFDTINEMVDSFRKEIADNFQKVMEE
jgi:hypothetical protein